MARWVVDGAAPLPQTFFVGAVEDAAVTGHLSLKVQPITLGDGRTPVMGADGVALHEGFVQTFAVDEARRRHGLGRALQQAGLALAAELGCYQMRSWSSADRAANYALKIGLHFAIQPGTHTLPDGTEIYGVFFVQTVEG